MPLFVWSMLLVFATTTFLILLIATSAGLPPQIRGAMLTLATICGLAAGAVLA